MLRIDNFTCVRQVPYRGRIYLRRFSQAGGSGRLGQSGVAAAEKTVRQSEARGTAGHRLVPGAHLGIAHRGVHVPGRLRQDLARLEQRFEVGADGGPAQGGGLRILGGGNVFVHD